MDKLPEAAYVKLRPPEDELHPDLLAQYNVASLAPEGLADHVDNLLLSPRGVTPDGELVVCTRCFDSLDSARMPKFAIANG
jgi:hypothetical protein